MEAQELAERLVRRTLKDDFLRLQVVHYLMSEYVGPTAQCRVTLTVQRAPGAWPRETVDCNGVGFVEAVYRGLTTHFASTWPGIADLHFTGFQVAGQMETSRDQKGLDAEATVRVEVRNTSRNRFRFEASGRSTLAASIRAVARVIEHFVNAERAASRLRLDAELARRAGLIDDLARIRNDLEDLRPIIGTAA